MFHNIYKIAFILLKCFLKIGFKHLNFVFLQVLENLKYANFTTKNGAKVFFDENGDSVAQYDLVNWQIKENASVEIVQIGQYDDSLPDRQKLKLKEDAKIVWGGDRNEVIMYDFNRDFDLLIK